MQKNFNFRNELSWFQIDQDKCLICKILSAPLFFMFGASFAMKNRNLWKTKEIENEFMKGTAQHH